MNRNDIELRVLHLEDSPRDHELIREILDEDGIHCQFRCVKNRDDFTVSLECEQFDLILSDFTLPGYDGLSALQTAHDAQPETPFIFVSGTIGEERAVESLKNGATDYVLKANLRRLAPAILRALREAKARAEREGAEAAFRASESRYRTLFETMDEGFCVVDILYDPDGQAIDFRFVEINPAFEKQTGLKQATGRTIRELVPDFEAHWFEIYEKVVRTGESIRFESPANAMQRFYDVFAFRVGGDGSPRVGILFNDITERKGAEDRLRESEALYHSLVENLPQNIFRKDQAGRFTFANRRFCEFIGKPLPDLLGKTDADLFPCEIAKQYQAADKRMIDTGEPFDSVEEIELAGASKRFIQTVKTPLRGVNGQIIGIQGIFWDITEKKKLEEQVLRGQRLESLGTLAGGIAHDFNNALAPILMSAELLQLEYPDAASNRLEIIQTSARRGADMVRQLMAFARGTEGERLILQPRHLLKEIGKLIRGTFPKNIRLLTNCAIDLQTILGDVTQIQQVLLNLCVNARDAMPNGGTLSLEAENQEIDAPCSGAVPEATPGLYVVLRVKDTGIGMTSEILDRIFEPFFTTKEPQKGTGLGLANVIGIVKGHRGFVRVLSSPGQGSTFEVYLPAFGSPADERATPNSRPTPFAGNGELILVVDDEICIRAALRALLTHLNFRVLTAADGTEALLHVAAHGSDLRAVITDLQMPHLNGLSFVRLLKGKLPDVGTIVMSGRFEEEQLTEFKALGVTALLEKPFTESQFKEALKILFADR